MSFSWLASTWTAAPVVNPFTRDSLSNDARLPSRSALITTICRPHANAAAVTTWLAVYRVASSAPLAAGPASTGVAYVCTSFSVITLTTDSVPTEMCRDVPNAKYTSVGKTAM